MIKEAIEKILEISRSEVKEINGENYLVKMDGIERIKPVDYVPAAVNVHSLDAVVELIKQENDKLPSPLFVHVDRHDCVNVYSEYAGKEGGYHHDRYRRFDLCTASCADIHPFTDSTMEYEQTLVILRSMFVQNEGTEYLINLLSRITEENSSQSEDNGVSQTVTVKSGIGLVKREGVKPRIPLKPFRTFLEIEQPESEFLLRVLPEKNIHLREADGGMWKLEARKRIAAYFKAQLTDLINDKKVIVMI